MDCQICAIDKQLLSKKIMCHVFCNSMFRENVSLQLVNGRNGLPTLLNTLDLLIAIESHF